MSNQKSEPVAKTQHFQETMQVSDGADTSPGDPGPALPPESSMGRYRIERQLGEGAMGAVYLAFDSQLNRKVALKVPKFAGDADPKLIERFYREARAAATLTHPNICPVYDVGEIDGANYIAMAYIQGRPLSDFVNPEKRPSAVAIAKVIRKIALALQEAHSQGVIHRDLKPANIMIDQRNEPIVMDFGLARQVSQDEEARLTRDGAIIGSPAYMSPEQLEGDPDKIGPGADIYSLGVMLFELLTGELPFKGRDRSFQSLAKSYPRRPRTRPKAWWDSTPGLAKFAARRWRRIAASGSRR